MMRNLMHAQNPSRNLLLLIKAGSWVARHQAVVYDDAALHARQCFLTNRVMRDILVATLLT